MVNMLYNIIVLKLSIFFCMIYTYMTIAMTYNRFVSFLIVIYDVILTSNPKFKIRKLNKNKNKRIKCFRLI